MSLMAFVKFGYALIVVTFLLMMWASLSRATDLHVDTGAPPCLFQALCTCSKPAGDLGIVSCYNVPILRVPPTVNSSKVYKLQLTNNRIRDLEPHFFQATGLFKLAINQNPLETIHEEAFYGLDTTLWELELKQDKLTAVPSRALRYLQKLISLDLSGNEISDISGDSWRGLEHTLQTLILADNSIVNIPLDAFSGLPMLETLDLSGNHLTIIDSGVFRDGMGRLYNLILADNQIPTIPYEQVSPLRQLRHLDLARNVIRQVPPAHDLAGVRLSLDTLKLDNNLISELLPGSFKFFNVLNETSLDGNPLSGYGAIREDAFRNAKIKSLSLKNCGIWDISPSAFAGLENSLQSLDLSENNLTLVSKFMLNKLDALRFLNLRENKVDINLIASNVPMGYEPTPYNNFQYKLFTLDISGANSYEMTLQDLRRMRSLRSLSIGKLFRRSISTEDFLEYGVELEHLKIVGSTLNRIESGAFQHVRTIRTLDLSENSIEYIDPFAFAELHSMTKLTIAHGLADTVKILPFEALKAVVDLQELDLSNNKLKNVPDTSFHFLYKLRILNLQDNEIEQFSKGTLQGDIHKQLEGVYLSFNKIKLLNTHTFVNLRELHEIWLEDNLIELIEHRSFSSLDNLKTIKLKGNRIYGITAEAFQNLPALSELDISFNMLNDFKFEIFDQVGSAAALKVNASYNQLIVLQDSNSPSFYGSNYFAPPKAQSLTVTDSVEDVSNYQGFSLVSVNIRVLDFSHNNITWITPYYFRHADSTLSELYLSYNKLKNITREVFGSLSMLQYLDLSNNEIFFLEYDCFKRGKNLQILDLSDNYISDLPVDVFREMMSLTSVDLSNNRIKTLLDNVFPSPALESLDLSHNGLSRIPTNCLSPAAAGNLVEMDLSSNYIPAISLGDLTIRYRNSDQNGEYWPEEPDYNDEYMYHTARRDHTRVFHQKKQFPQNILYKSLAVLDLSNNHLVRVESGSFSALPRLKWLDLSNNLPFNSGERSGNVFKGLERRLSHLGLKNVSLVTIPSMPLPKLKSLDLSYNNLPSIPPETTANLTRLRVLDLSYNDFSTVPVATHSLSDLRWLSLSGNPITALLNTSLYGVSPRLEYLDVTRLRVRMLEHGAFSKMFCLRTLKISVYPNVRDYSIPKMIANNHGLKNLYIQVENPDTELGREMTGLLPNKLNNITITGRMLRYLAPYLFSGMQSESLSLTIFNTSIEDIPSEVFWRPGKLQNLTLDVRNNLLTKVSNPGIRGWPGVPNSIFLNDVLVAENPLYCDCGIGWIEGWDRKRRQYLCKTPSSCLSSRDDLRFATCPAYYNRSLSDILAKELDCTWNTGFSISSNLLIVIGMGLLTCLYI